jgi:hypothetical protein
LGLIELACFALVVWIRRDSMKETSTRPFLNPSRAHYHVAAAAALPATIHHRKMQPCTAPSLTSTIEAGFTTS